MILNTLFCDSEIRFSRSEMMSVIWNGLKFDDKIIKKWKRIHATDVRRQTYRNGLDKRRLLIE